MKTKTKILFLITLFLFLTSCGMLVPNPEEKSSSSSLESHTLIISAPAGGKNSGTPNGYISVLNKNNGNYAISANVTEIGKIPQDAALWQNKLYVLQSGSQSLLVLNWQNLSIQTEIALGNNTNPYALAITNSGKAYISNFAAQSLTVVDLTTNKIMASIDLPSGNALASFNSQNPSYACPEGIAYDNNKIYVALTNLEFTNWFPGGPGLIVVIDVNTDKIIKTITLNHTNPQYLYLNENYPHQLWVSETGSYDNTGLIEVIDTEKDVITAKINIKGAPGRIAINADGKGFVTDSSWGSGVRLLSFDANTFTVNNPIQVSADGWASCLALDKDGHLLVTNSSTNEDSLYILSATGNIIQGPLNTGDAPMIIISK